MEREDTGAAWWKRSDSRRWHSRRTVLSPTLLSGCSRLQAAELRAESTGDVEEEEAMNERLRDWSLILAGCGYSPDGTGQTTRSKPCCTFIWPAQTEMIYAGLGGK